MAQEYISILNGKLIKDKESRQYIGDVTNLQTDNKTDLVSAINDLKSKQNDLDTTIDSTSTDKSVPSSKAAYNYGQTLKALGLTDTKENQVLSIKTIDENGAPQSYSTIDPISDTELNNMLIEVLDSITIKQNASTLILNSSTQDSEKQFEVTIDDTGTITAQEL